MRSWSAVSVALSVLVSCHPLRTTDTLNERLEHSGYSRLFTLPAARQRLDRLWAEPGTPERMLDLAADTRAPWRARFLACEVIFHKQMFLILHRPELFASLADVYAKALVENASGSMADWGFASGMNDPGVVGIRFVVFGLDADHALQPLLDETGEVAYVYPLDGPFRTRTGLRVKDFAALHLGELHQIPVRLTEDPAQRDAEIRRLRSLLRRP